jgi:FkbM family methyltransferase
MITKIIKFLKNRFKNNAAIPLELPHAPGTGGRPIGKVKSFLEDIKARGFKASGILDIGANRGEWSSMALEVMSDACSVMIEPQSEMNTYLEALCSTDQRCRFFNCGAGRENTELVLTIWEDTYGSSYTVPKNEEYIKTGKQRVTPIKTVDSILLELGVEFKPDLVKIDVQGFELEVLEGGKSLFGVTEVFIIETTLFVGNHPLWPSTREVIEFMGKRGYEIYDITSFLRKPSDGALGQVDFAFVKADGMFRQNLSW